MKYLGDALKHLQFSKLMPMKQQILSLILSLFLLNNCSAQLQMSNWLIVAQGVSILSFKELPSKFIPLNKKLPTGGSQAAYSDKSGKFLYGSNGFYMYNRNYTKMQNGSINLSSYLWNTNWIDYGMPIHGGGGFLEDPGSDTMLYFIYTSIGTGGKIGTDTVLGPHKDKLHLLKIDMLKDSILFKDSVILDISQTNPSFIRHGNGKNWWIVSGEYYKTKYHIFKLTAGGITESKEQIIGQMVSDSLADCYGWVEFSMDGSKYCRNYAYDGIQVLDFDRCSGEFSNPVFVPLKKPSLFQGSGANISPNNRFLYSNTRQAVLQFDLLSNDIVGSMDTIAVFDNMSWNDFAQGSFGLDEKLYFQAYNGITDIAIIDRPNLKGKLSNFRYHALHTSSGESIAPPPILINYKLGAIDPPCEE